MQETRIIRNNMLDIFDYKLLNALQSDGRLTNQDLSERVGLSPSQCSRRRAALEESGIIKNYAAQLNSEALGFAVIAFVSVTLHKHSHENATIFKKLVASTPLIQTAHSLTGQYDYLLKVCVKDLRALADFIDKTLLGCEIVAQVHSSIVLNRLKEEIRLML